MNEKQVCSFCTVASDQTKHGEMFFKGKLHGALICSKCLVDMTHYAMGYYAGKVKNLENLQKENLKNTKQNINSLNEINKKLKSMLIERDGGGHDTDCKTNYGRQCTCGHDAVKKLLKK